jgi:hypothetical protein
MEKLHGHGRADTEISKSKSKKCCRRKKKTKEKAMTRVSCLECVEKHLGAAMVLCSEMREGYQYRLLVIGHLHEAAEESQEYTELHNAIQEARKAYQNDNIPPNWELLGTLMERTKGNSVS